MAVVEVCGFHDWLVKWLQQDERCHQVLVVQPLGRIGHKTDRRDANALSELLWVNRERCCAEIACKGCGPCYLPSVEQQADRHLTQLRERLVRRRTQTLNQIHKILRRHNLEWERPTKSFQTRKVTEWLKTLASWARWTVWPWIICSCNGGCGKSNSWRQTIRLRSDFSRTRHAQLLATMPGVSMFIALAIACRIAPIGRFPHGRSLANFLGLTPGSSNSGDTERLGSITKAGSRMVRFLLAQVILHLLRRDDTVRAWYQRIKRRRGVEDRTGGGDAADGHDHVADAQRRENVGGRELPTRRRPAANDPRQPRLWRPRRTMLSALSASEADAAGFQYRFLFSVLGEEVTRCPA